MKNLKKNTLLFLAAFLGSVFSAGAADIWVALDGKNTNPGTKEAPLASIHLALRKARDLRRINDPSVKEGIHIIVKGGVYFLSEPLFVRPEDSGSAASPTVIEAAPGEKPVFSGGLEVKSWKPAVNKADLPGAANGKVWVADVPENDLSLNDFRQIWVNGQKATRARDTNFPAMQRILSWDKKAETCWIPAPAAKTLKGGKGLEMFIHQWWAIANLRIKEIFYQGDSARLTFFQPESHIQSEHPWPAPWISKKTGNSAFFLSNDIALLDQPGEWYFDKSERKLYYWPRKGEDISRAEVIAAGLETLVKIQGTAEDPVKYVSFKGIGFEHAGWLRPSLQGHVPLQAGMYMLDAYKLKPDGTPKKEKLENQAWLGRPASAVQVINSAYTAFENCRFEHLASTGLDYYRGNLNDQIKGNLFKDIGGTAINAGVFSDEAFEAHLAFNPQNACDITTGLNINNNLITDVTNEDWGCVGIGAGFVKNTVIEHNEINEVSYSAISLGWGWTPDRNIMENNIVRANKIHHYGRNLYDVAGIYTLSSQPNSLIAENYIDSIYVAPYAHDHHHWFYLYCDEGSAHFTVKDNWTPVAKFLQNANGPANVWTNNGPQVSRMVKERAGLIAQYRSLLANNAPAQGEINSVYRHPEADHSLAMTFPVLDKQQLDTVKSVFRGYGISETSFYYGKDRTIVFDDFLKDAPKIRTKILEKIPSLNITVSANPKTTFSRAASCGAEGVTAEWSTYVLVKKTGVASVNPAIKQLCKSEIQRVLNFNNEIIIIDMPYKSGKGSRPAALSSGIFKALGLSASAWIQIK